MKTRILRSLALLLVLCPLIARGAAPANDKFSNATVLNGRVVTLANQTGVGSTADSLDPYIAGTKLARSVWYRFDGLFGVTKNHLIVSHAVAARIGVFSLFDPDGGAGSLVLVTQVSNQAGGTDTLTFSTSPGRRYYVCIEANGVFDITLQLAGQNNDFFADATVLNGNQGTINGSNVNCINTNDQPTTPAPLTPTNGVWYSWTPSITTQMAVDTNFSFLGGSVFHDTMIVVFTGSSLDTLTAIASDDDGGIDLNSRVSFPAVAGTTYHIWVGDVVSNGSGPFTLEYFPETSPGILGIVTSGPNVGENQGITTFEVRRMYAGSVAPSVNVSTVNGTAIAGLDFTGITNQAVSFLSGASGSNGAFRQTVNLTILPDNAPEPSRSFSLSLSAPTLGATIGASPVSLKIINEPAILAPGFASATMRVKEADGLVYIPISRSSALGAADVSIYTNYYGNDTAISGSDYVLYTTTFNFAPGQTTAFIPVGIYSDGFSEGDETFTLFISPVLPGTTIDGMTLLTVTIADASPPLPLPGRLSAVLDGFSIDGSLTINLTAAGAVTGKLVMAKGVFAFTGKLDASGYMLARIGPATAPNRTLVIQLLNSATQTYQVTLNDTDLGTTNTVTLTATNYSAINLCPAFGSYTLADTGGGTVPQLVAASIKVDVLGNATLSGKIFDGTALLASGAVDSQNIASIGASLYAGQGRLTLSTLLGNVFQTQFSGSLHLLRPGRANQSAELQPLNVFPSSWVARYAPPAANTRLFTLWNPAGAGNADLSAGGYMGTVTQSISVSLANAVTLSGVSTIPSLKIALSPATGLFTGSVIPPGATVAKPIYGVLLQAGPSSRGRGFFLNGIMPGGVILR